jgi:hypothetical protein
MAVLDIKNVKGRDMAILSGPNTLALIDPKTTIGRIGVFDTYRLKHGFIKLSELKQKEDILKDRSQIAEEILSRHNNMFSSYTNFHPVEIKSIPTNGFSYPEYIPILELFEAAMNGKVLLKKEQYIRLQKIIYRGFQNANIYDYRTDAEVLLEETRTLEKH